MIHTLRQSGIPDHVVNTPYLIEGVNTAHTVVTSRAIGLFDGPVGVGKTTTKDWVVREMDVPVADVTMPPKPNPLAALRFVVRALTGERATGTKEQLEDQAIDLLTDWGGLLTVDEVQTIGTSGISELRYLHDMTRASFGLLLIGHGAEAAIRSDPALDSRVAWRARFRQLDGEDLLAVLHQLDPRLAATTPTVLEKVNSRHCVGRLRDWAQVLTTLDMHFPDDTRITGNRVPDLLAILHRPRIDDPLTIEANP